MKSPMERSLEDSRPGYSLWGCKESGMTEQLSMKKLLHSKEKYKQNEKTTLRMGENIANKTTDKRLTSVLCSFRFMGLVLNVFCSNYLKLTIDVC